MEQYMGGWVDKDLVTTETTEPSFQVAMILNFILEWEKKLKLIFDCNNYSKKRKVKAKLEVIESTNYAITLGLICDK